MHTNQRNGIRENLQNKKVHFPINDACIPEPAQILTELHGRDLLHGRVIELSDRGAERDAFAVVAVDGLNQPVVVPTANLTAMDEFGMPPTTLNQ